MSRATIRQYHRHRPEDPQSLAERVAAQHATAETAKAALAAWMGARPVRDAPRLRLPSGATVFVNARAPSAYTKLPGIVLGGQGYLGEDYAVATIVQHGLVTVMGYITQATWVRDKRAEESMGGYRFFRVWPDGLVPGLPESPAPPGPLGELTPGPPGERRGARDARADAGDVGVCLGASRWPDTIESLGPRTVGPFEACVGCRRVYSWAWYGEVVLCLECARERA